MVDEDTDIVSSYLSPTDFSLAANAHQRCSKSKFIRTGDCWLRCKGGLLDARSFLLDRLRAPVGEPSSYGNVRMRI